MAVALSEKLTPDYLDQTGILRLGGEQRIARYETLDDNKAPVVRLIKDGSLMTLSPLGMDALKNQGIDQCLRASGPLQRIAGWDMQKQFHKPVTAYLPAGTVIITDNNVTIPFGFISI